MTKKSILSGACIQYRKTFNIVNADKYSSQLVGQGYSGRESFTYLSVNHVLDNSPHQVKSCRLGKVSLLQKIRNFSISGYLRQLRNHLSLTRLNEQADAIDELKDIYRL